MSKARGETYLYHYTTAKGLIGIVEQKKIWATEIFYLNDWEEFLAGLKLATEHLRRLLDKAVARKDKVEAERSRWLIKEMKSIGALRSLSMYVCSFSADDDELSQWRAYCPKGGFAIGFPAKRLRALAKKQKFVLRKCTYSPDRQAKMVKDAVDTVVQAKPTPHELLSAGPNAESVIRCTLSNNLAWKLAQVCPILKNAAFKSEKESRLISEPRSGGDIDQWSFRADGGMVVPYKEFLLNDSTLWRKARVTIGPPPHPKESFASVYKLLRCNTGFAHAITNSRAPYRTW